LSANKKPNYYYIYQFCAIVFKVFCVCKVVESVDLWEAVLSEVAPSLWRSEIMTRVSSSVIAVGCWRPKAPPDNSKERQKPKLSCREGDQKKKMMKSEKIKKNHTPLLHFSLTARCLVFPILQLCPFLTALWRRLTLSLSCLMSNPLSTRILFESFQIYKFHITLQLQSCVESSSVT
jgi:hypothetical protein